MKKKTPSKSGSRPHTGGMKKEKRPRTDRSFDSGVAKKLSRRLHQQEVFSYISLIALANPDIYRFMNEAVAYVARTLDVDFAKVMELDQASDSLLFRAGVGWNRTMKPGVTRFKAKSTHAGYVLLSRKPVVIRDMRKEKKDFNLPHLRRHKIVSGASVIIPGVRNPYGVLGVYSKRPKAFTDDDINFLQSVANVVALSFERYHAESELRRFQYMADNANVSISLIDKDGRFRYANKITYERLGYTREEYMKKRVIYKNDLHSTPKFKELFKLIQKKQVPPIETFEMKKGGEISVPIELNLTGVTFENEPYMFAVSQDISERKRSQQNLEFLAEASLILGSSLNYEETLASVASAASAHIADWCAVDMVDDGGVIRQVVVAHRDPKKVEWAKELRRRQPVDMSAEQGLPNVLRTGRAEIYPNITDEMLVAASKGDKAMLAVLREINYKSVMIVPIRTGKRTIGAITFVTTETRRNYNQSDLAIALELANRAALAVENSRLYAEIENQRERLGKIIANVPGVVWEMWTEQDPAENRINFASEYVEKMVGYSTKEWLEPFFWLSVVHPDDRLRAEEERATMLNSGKGMVQRLRWVHKNGRVIWTESYISVITDPKGRVLGMRGVTMDASERMELEKRKDEFISMASHELKTPVTTLKVFTQILQKHAGKTEDQTGGLYLSKMDAQISRLTDLINDLLDLSKIQTGKLTFKLSKFDLEELVHEIVEQIQPTDDNHKLLVEGGIRRKVTGDRDRLGQVLINLLTNAIKYSPQADKVVIHLSEDANNAKIGVEDFGIGIPEDQQMKIFNRFYQVTDGDQKNFPGLGIGLYISDEIMRRHGGTIDVLSAKGKGSVFNLTLPFKTPKDLIAEAELITTRQ